MPKYRVLRKCFFQNRIYDPAKEPVVNMELKPKDVPRHFKCLDKPAKQQEQQKQGSEQEKAE